MDIEGLRELGFNIYPEEKRAVLQLSSKDDSLRLEVEEDESIHLNVAGFKVKLNVKPPMKPEKVVQGLKGLFNETKIDLPF